MHVEMNVSHSKKYNSKSTMKTLKNSKVKQGETSSGYSSRESLHDVSINKRRSSSLPNSSCVCSKTISKNSNSLQPYNTEENSMEQSSPTSNSISWGISTTPCCHQHATIMSVNEQLMLQNQLYEEHNNTLQEELQMARRFYQTTISELSSQLAQAENRIKYLVEAVNANKEAQVQANDKDNSNTQPNLNTTNDVKNIQTTQKPPSVCNGSTVNGNTSLHGKILQGRKGYAKMKEHLLAKNQILKCDIENLKYKSDIPRSSSVPVLNLKEFPDIHSSRSYDNNNFVHLKSKENLLQKSIYGK